MALRLLDSILVFVTLRFNSLVDLVCLHADFILDSIQDATLDSILDTLYYFAFDISPLIFLV